MPLNKLCANRVHEWGPDGICTRAGCGKVKGLRGPRAHGAGGIPRRNPVAAVPPAVRPVAVAPLAPAAGNARFREAAAKLAARRGSVSAVAPLPPADGKGTEVQAEGAESGEAKPKKVYSLTDWFGGKIPEAIRGGCAWAVRKGGHDPFEADKDWSDRFDDSYNEAVRGALPELNFPAPLAMCIAAFMMWLSMRWGAPALPSAAADGDHDKRDSKPVDPKGEPCQDPTVPPSAAILRSVPASASPPSPSILVLPFGRPEGKDNDGPAKAAAPLSLVGESATASALSVMENGKDEKTP